MCVYIYIYIYIYVCVCVYIYIYIYYHSYISNRAIGRMSRVFANSLESLCSIPGRVIPKTQKWYLMPPRLKLSIIRLGSRVKWSNLGKGVTLIPTPRCSSY